ncbi:hypothetical protein E2562_016052 [Oryza meyeriana var. granulata]|uniref:Uncharacterized protein n=1 Tax=Oryza meyeriana var. granulata TaxID=110450 RepID=A0A6G1BME2_9ORYZ|nr:hypothetical protein E2562_016052 [Oryza meyeriana var. granulata]
MALKQIQGFKKFINFIFKRIQEQSKRMLSFRVLKDRRSGWLEDIYTGITGEGETLGSVQQWHAKGPKRARPSKTQHRRHTGMAARESDDDGSD